MLYVAQDRLPADDKGLEQAIADKVPKTRPNATLADVRHNTARMPIGIEREGEVENRGLCRGAAVRTVIFKGSLPWPPLQSLPPTSMCPCVWHAVDAGGGE